MKEPASVRLQELDALRGIAAMMVVWFHYTLQYDELFGHVQRPIFAFPPGRYGVQLFFVISGFVIFLTLSRAKSIWDFAANRFSRLYPPYWVCIGITFTAMLLMPMPGLNVSGVDAVLNLTMLQYWMQRPSVDGVYWTLAVELAFYVMVSALFILGWVNKVERWVAAWLVLIFAVRFADMQGHSISPLIRTLLLLDHGHFFFAGVLFYRMKQEGFTIIRGCLLVGCIAAAWYVRDGPHAVALLLASAVFATFIRGWLGFLCVWPLLWLGEISYPLYLLHQHIGYALIARLEKAGFVAEVWLLVPVAVVLLLATLVNRWVEKPSRDWIRSRWKRSGLRARLTASLASPSSAE